MSILKQQMGIECHKCTPLLPPLAAYYRCHTLLPLSYPQNNHFANDAFRPPCRERSRPNCHL
jgi:hypothetical protein